MYNKGVSALLAKKIKSCCISQKESQSLKNMENGEYQIVFLTPEMLLINKRCRSMLISEIYYKRFRLFVVDEAHTIKTWLVLYGYIMLLFLSILRGQSFRKIMLHIR